MQNFQLEEGKEYEVTVATRFTGKFVRLEHATGVPMAVFEQSMMAQPVGKAPESVFRRVALMNIIEAEDPNRD